MKSLFRGDRHPRPPRGFSTDQPVPYPVFEVEGDFSLSEAGPMPDVLRTSRMALAAAAEALDDAQWDRRRLRSLRVGVCIGTSAGSTLNNDEFYMEFHAGRDPSMAPVERFLRSNPSGFLARMFRLSGPCQSVVTACASGTDTIGVAASWIRNGVCDVVLAGGAEELCRFTYNGFISLKVTDAFPCKPFDARRNGLNLGEGAAVLVLESEEVRKLRGKGARAYVLGYGSANDAHHLTAPSPEGKGLRRALGEAMTQAGLSAGDVAFVNAHGTGTLDNDRTESGVIADLLPGVPFLSTKGYTGHALGAAGAIEAAFTVACLEEGRIPASGGFADPDAGLPALPVDRETAVKGHAALSQSLAFGGHNAVLAFGISPMAVSI
jgi:3-oxoacyl-[acyl-carrier-protein] synthase-1/3-oxoacyl-[acyl-carrier-protein] synthase II